MNEYMLKAEIRSLRAQVARTEADWLQFNDYLHNTVTGNMVLREFAEEGDLFITIFKKLAEAYHEDKVNCHCCGMEFCECGELEETP